MRLPLRRELVHCSYSIVFRLFHASSSLSLLHRRFLLNRKVLKQTLDKLNEASAVDIGESNLAQKQKQSRYKRILNQKYTRKLNAKERQRYSK